MRRKGQSSVELVLMIALALVLSAPFIFAAQSSVIELNDASRLLDLDHSLKKVRVAALELNSSSYPARRTVEFETPSNVEDIYNPNVSGGGSALVFEVRAQGEDVNRSILFDNLELELTEEADLAEEGIHDLSLRRADNQVNVSVIS